MDAQRVGRKAAKIRSIYPAVSAMADAFAEHIPYSAIEIPCSGKEYAILERLRVLLARESEQVTATAILLDIDWVEITHSEAGRTAISWAIILAANGESLPPVNGYSLNFLQ